jgi:hypothetical protein
MSDTKFVERWYSDAFKDRKIALQIFKDLKKNLKIIPHPFTGWRSFPNQKLKTLEINENGLRSKSLKNLKFKKNCILLGGSVAWGFGASSNENTPAYKLESFLNTRHKLNYNVINLSEQSHSSIEEMNTFISAYHELKPEMIIIFSGANDANFEFEKKYKRIDLYDSVLNFYLWGDKIGIFREKNFFKTIIKIFLRYFKKNKTIDDEFFYFKKLDENQYANEMYKTKLDFISNFCEMKKVKVFNILQPDLFFKSKKSQFELDYCEFEGDERKDFFTKKFAEFENFFFNNKNNKMYVKNLSLLNCFDDYEETIFMDRCHTADKGYEIISEKISNFISENIS